MTTSAAKSLLSYADNLDDDDDDVFDPDDNDEGGEDFSDYDDDETADLLRHPLLLDEADGIIKGKIIFEFSVPLTRENKIDTRAEYRSTLFSGMELNRHSRNQIDKGRN